jgi:alkylated DNA repair protein (DNA oxidative demethylase)
VCRHRRADHAQIAQAWNEGSLEEGAVLLRGFATDNVSVLLEDVAHVVQAAPVRHLVTPGGSSMSVAMTNCGRVGWVSDGAG